MRPRVAEGARADSERDVALAARATSEAETDARATAEAEANSQRDVALAAEATAESEAQVRATAEAIALNEQEEAQRQATLATARELAAFGLVSLEEDPERTILLALRSLDLAYTEEGEEVLRPRYDGFAGTVDYPPHTRGFKQYCLYGRWFDAGWC